MKNFKLHWKTLNKRMRTTSGKSEWRIKAYIVTNGNVKIKHGVRHLVQSSSILARITYLKKMDDKLFRKVPIEEFIKSVHL